MHPREEVWVREGRGGVSQVLSIRSYIPYTTCGWKEVRDLPGTDPAAPGGGQGSPWAQAPSTQLPSRPPGAVGAQHPRQAETKGGRYWGTKSQLPSALKTVQKQQKVL